MKFLLLLSMLFLALVLFIIFDADNGQQARIDQATTPEQLATVLLSGTTKATLDNGVLLINRTVDAVLTASTAVSWFNVLMARVVPAVFAKFPQVQSIVVHESGPFTDIKGNESTEEMLRIAFTREESDQIHWDKINYDDVPKLGEHYWMHPGLRRGLQAN